MHYLLDPDEVHGDVTKPLMSFLERLQDGTLRSFE